MFTIRRKLDAQTDLLIGIGSIAVVIAVWCVLTYGGYVKPLFLPTPTGIWEGIAAFQERGWLFPAILRSTWRVAQALLLVIVIGAPLGLLMGAFPAVDAALRKLVNGGKSIPTTGILGLIVLWFSIEERAKIVFLFLGAIFYMIILVKNAVQNVPEDYLRVATDIGANGWQMISRVLIPGALPQIWDAFAVCNGIMWTYIVLAEFINSNEEQLGLGYLLQIGTRTNESGRVFAVLILIALISSLSDFLFQAVRRKFLNW
jgi:ABC-type nitrate/sulfonate/bicarbonate transport system permease component